MTRSITERDAQVLELILGFIAEKGYPPTVREVGEHLGMSSPSTVQAHLVALVEGGYIERTTPGSPRALRVLRKLDDPDGVPPHGVPPTLTG